MKTLATSVASLLAVATLVGSAPALAAEDGGNGAVTTRADSGAAKQDDGEDDDGCSASGAKTDLTGTGSVALLAGLGAVVVLARGRRRAR